MLAVAIMVAMLCQDGLSYKEITGWQDSWEFDHSNDYVCTASDYPDCIRISGVA